MSVLNVIASFSKLNSLKNSSSLKFNISGLAYASVPAKPLGFTEESFKSIADPKSDIFI